MELLFYCKINLAFLRCRCKYFVILKNLGYFIVKAITSARCVLRFVEIQEKLCHGVDRGEHQCHSNHHEWEEHLETWWRLDPDTRAPLKQWLCVDQLKVCCPENAYGPQCTPCSLVTNVQQASSLSVKLL